MFPNVPKPSKAERSFRNLNAKDTMSTDTILTTSLTTGLTPSQRRAALMLASGASQNATAKAVKTSPQTMCAWMKLDAFKAEIDGHLSTVEGEALALLKGQRLKAVEALSELLESKAPAVRLAAARTVLELTSKNPPATGSEAKYTAILALLEGHAS